MASEPQPAAAALGDGSCTIRAFQPADLDQVHELFANGMRDAHTTASADMLELLEAYIASGISDDLGANMQAVFLGERCGFWVVIDERAESPTKGRIIGTVGCQALDEAECELRRLSVHRGSRGLGLATRLIGVVEAHAKAHGFRRIVLNTSMVMVPAQRLYSKAGYDVVKREHFPDEWMLQLTGRTRRSDDEGAVYYAKTVG